ncbi:hypothetical protein GCM10017566_39800 [Amycolatopsis bartoniae]|uniref:Glycosyl hydrolase n=1 Tax=Amycolatopsis bartoniae TaxID=941986 RepID=A0A8H9M653_9PSEU|nr:hypothetical protein GCM10017566_39800 [Amycolatopsis bartoniae]
MLLAALLLVTACSGSNSKQGTTFAPYVDVTGTHPALDEVAASTGQKDFVLAFVLASGTTCTPTWGGTKALTDPELLQQIKAASGNVTVATGGANGTYLENACTDATALKAAYESTLDTLGTNSLDLDIEQDIPVNTVVQALKQLQDERGTKIMLTLKVESSGLTDSGVQLLQAAQAADLDVTVNAMLMNFATTGDWATSLVQSLDTVTAQIRRVWTDLDDEGAHRMLGATLMIGQNDTGEVTTTSVAQTVLDAVADRDLAFAGFWSLNRDNGDCAGTTTTSGTCSGVSQTAYEFTSLFQKIA